MFSILNLIDERLERRYETLERNIKAKSNSFYDSYLDLLETTVKVILDNEGIIYDSSKTCGAILRDPSVCNFFTEDLGINYNLYRKFFDYAKKVNDHKHKDEKWLSLDSIINYLRVYYVLIKTYATRLNLPYNEEFDESYYQSIFGLTLKENGDLKEEKENLADRLLVIEDKIDGLLPKTEAEKKNPLKELLKTEPLLIKRKYGWNFKTLKTFVIVILSTYLFLDLIATIFNIIAFKDYTVGNFLRNLFSILILKMLLQTIKSDEVMTLQMLNKKSYVEYKTYDTGALFVDTKVRFTLIFIFMYFLFGFYYLFVTFVPELKTEMVPKPGLFNVSLTLSIINYFLTIVIAKVYKKLFKGYDILYYQNEENKIFVDTVIERGYAYEKGSSIGGLPEDVYEKLKEFRKN